MRASLFVATAASVLVLFQVGNRPGIIPNLLLLDIGFGGGGPVFFVDSVLAPVDYVRMIQPNFLKAVKTRKNMFD